MLFPDYNANPYPNILSVLEHYPIKERLQYEDIKNNGILGMLGIVIRKGKATILRYQKHGHTRYTMCTNP